ncbi:hypothetical protein [Dactylosporangium sp. NPDC051541]|uniref:hypothetical protein n=1 Tax=Dactylosporangium sp. NPDC051541 TaxID=3363977 RepID=UPI003788A8CF
MKPFVREIASLVIGLSGIVAAGVGLDQVLDIGSCASGGPYEIANPCPEGADATFWMIVAGALGWIAGIIVSPRAFLAPGAGQFLWVAGFAGGGVALLIKVLTQEEMPADARLGGSIVAATFLPMGLVVGVVGVVQLVRQRAAGRVRPSPAAAKPYTTVDAWTRLKALNDLRSVGALTRAEFVTLRNAPDNVATDARVAPLQRLAEQWRAGGLSTAEFEAEKRAVLGSAG